MRYFDFEDVFRHVYPRVTRTLMVISGDKEMSSRIAQEALGQAYAHWKKFQKQDSPLNWVRCIAVNKLRDEMNNKEVVSKIDLTTILDLTTYETLEKAIRTPYAIDFVRAVSNLDTSERFVATLSFIDDYSPSEIAMTLNRKEEEVLEDISNARKSIRNNMSHTS